MDKGKKGLFIFICLLLGVIVFLLIYIFNNKLNVGESMTYKNIVEDALYEYNPKAALSNCGDEEDYVYKDIRLPKINIDTDTVKNLNKKMLEHNKEINATKGGYDLIVDYAAKYIPYKNLLVINISEKQIAHCSSGGPVEYSTYVYDVKNDKVLTYDQLFSLYKIDSERFKNYAHVGLVDYHSQNLSGSDLSIYENRLDEMISNKSYVISNVDTYYIEVSFDIGMDEFTVRMYRKD